MPEKDRTLWLNSLKEHLEKTFPGYIVEMRETAASITPWELTEFDKGFLAQLRIAAV